MNCRNLKHDIQLYADGQLSSGRSGEIELHLASCPLCRCELDELRSLRNELRSLKPSGLSSISLDRIRSAVRLELSAAAGFPLFRLIEGNERWTEKWMWPTAIGTVTSLVFGVFLLAVILIPADVPHLAISADEPASVDDPIFLAYRDQVISPQQFASSRADISRESPSLNPGGTLVDVARSETRDDEAVVVADIYGNGSAEITNVVEVPRDRKMMNRLIAAFRPNRTAPPFVPASLDNREDHVRVVFKFQNVNVNIE